MYKHVESLFLKAANCKDYQSELKFVLDFYGSDLDEFSLTTPLVVSSTMYIHANLYLRKYTGLVTWTSSKTLTPSIKES